MPTTPPAPRSIGNSSCDEKHFPCAGVCHLLYSIRHDNNRSLDPRSITLAFLLPRGQGGHAFWDAMKPQTRLRGCVRAFHFSDEAFYARSVPPQRYTSEVMFGFYARAGGTSGEMAMRWYGGLGARLEVFGDSFEALAFLPDLIAALVDKGDVGPKEFCDLLLSLGFEDHTRRAAP